MYFTSSGSLVVAGGPPVTLEVFMVGGGGGGGGYAGGGGGAGGVVHHASIDCSNGTKPVGVGLGGARRSLGQDTTFLGMTAKGGGYGAEGGGAAGAGSPGGCGGGGAAGNNGAGKPGTQPSQNSPFTPDPNFNQYGNPGGLPHPGPGGNFASNGGGGAGGAGDSHPNGGPGGDGGAGIQYPTTPRSIKWIWNWISPILLLDGSLAVEEEQTEITQVLQLMDLLLDLVVDLDSGGPYAGGGSAGQTHLQVQQPSTHKVEEQTLEVVAVEVTLFQVSQT